MAARSDLYVLRAGVVPSLLLLAATCAAGATHRIRVCTSGGEGMCSAGAGLSTLSALRFLSSGEEFELKGCSCLAQCDRGVVLQLQDSGEFVQRVNDAAAAADVLRRFGVSVDSRLVDAFGMAKRADKHLASGRHVDALKGYNRAFTLSVRAGLAVQWRSLPASVLRAQQHRREQRPAMTLAQAAWLTQLMVSRSRTFSALSQQGWVRSARRALQDAQYAVQLSESILADDARGRAVAWERLAETHEAVRDIEGAILAYEQLLRVEPSFDPRLSPAVSAKRGVQELVLISHRRGLENAAEVREGLLQAEQASRESITRRALQDVERLRNLVDQDIGTLERVAEERGLKAGSGPRITLASRAMRDLGVMRKVAFSDINTLQMQILRGDPTVTLLRAVRAALGSVGQPRSQKKLPTLQQLSELADLSASGIPRDRQAYWLREQFELGALPSDPVLLRSLVEQARKNPDLITRLMTDAVRARGSIGADAAGVKAPGGTPAGGLAAGLLGDDLRVTRRRGEPLHPAGAAAPREPEG